MRKFVSLVFGALAALAVAHAQGTPTWHSDGSTTYTDANAPSWTNWTKLVYAPGYGVLGFLDKNGDQTTYSDTMFLFPTGGPAWTQYDATPSSTPCGTGSSSRPESRHVTGALAVDSKRGWVWMGPGVCQSNTQLDMWHRPISGGAWVKITTAAHLRDAWFQNYIYDPVHDVLIDVSCSHITGCITGTKTQVFAYVDGTGTGTPSAEQQAAGAVYADDWTDVSPATQPTGTALPLFVWNPQRGKAWLYGGYSSAQPANPMTETWEYDPATKTWTKFTTANHPGAQTDYGNVDVVGHAGDIVGNKLYFLRANQTASVSELWSFDGTDWSPVTTSSGPKNVTTVAYDPTSQKLLSWNFIVGGAPWVETWDLPLASVRTLATLTIREALYTGVSGIDRTNAFFEQGVPLSNAQAVTSTSTLNLVGSGGASVTGGQFRVTGCYTGAPTGAPAGSVMDTGCTSGGRIKWVLASGVLSSFTAGASATVLLQDGGSGNFGGSNLATPGTPISINTTAAQFTIKSGYHNGIDTAVVGGTTIVSTGTSQGFTLLGPDPTAAYPGNVTCSPTSGGTACTTVYSSANDSASTCSIEENGPVKAVVKCTFDHKDSGGTHTYMHGTARYYFYAGKSFVKVNSQLQNADYGTSNTFASAFKGHAGYEYRTALAASGPSYTYTLPTTTTPQTGTLTGSGAYLYIAKTNSLIGPEWPCGVTSHYTCVDYTTDTGWWAKSNGSTLASDTTGNNAPQGWADLSNGSGAGVEIGVYQAAGYYPKSLEFNSASDVRIGIWARENSQPYYQAWPQYSIHDLYLNFHSAAPSSLANEFLKFQHPLIAHAARTDYTAAGVFDPWPLIDPTTEDNYYKGVTDGGSGPVTPANPAIAQNRICCITDAVPHAYRFFDYYNGGGDIQFEQRWSKLLNFIRRDFTGGYLDSAMFYRMIAEKSYPRADGFTWLSHWADGGFDIEKGFPMNVTSANASLGFTDYLDTEHNHWYGMVDYYLMTGDETLHDFMLDGPLKYYQNTKAQVNFGAANTRGLGAHLQGLVRLGRLLKDTGDTTNSDSLINLAKYLYTIQVKPQLCVSGYPESCVSDPQNNRISGTVSISGSAMTRLSGASFNKAMESAVMQIPQGSGVVYQVSSVTDGDHLTLATTPGNTASTTWDFLTVGTSPLRGMNYNPGYAGYDNQCTSGVGQRSIHQFMQPILMAGVLELRNYLGSSWSEYNQSLDYLYGMSQFMLHEGFVDDGTGIWSSTPEETGGGNGFRYNIQLDVANNCGSGEFLAQAQQTVWLPFWVMEKETGSTSWQEKFNYALMRDASSLGITGPQATADFGQYLIGTVINGVNNPPAATLQNVALTGFSESPAGTYHLTWSAPAGITTGPSGAAYRLKWGAKQIVDWVGFDPATNAPIGDPATTMNWFAATDASSGLTAASTSATITATAGLSASNFALKAFATGTPTPFVSPTSLPAGTVGTAYPAQTLTASNFGGTVTWSLLSGSLPTGLSGCTSGTGTTCTIGGTPSTTTGSPFSFTIRASDGTDTVDTPYTVTISGGAGSAGGTVIGGAFVSGGAVIH